MPVFENSKSTILNEQISPIITKKFFLFFFCSIIILLFILSLFFLSCTKIYLQVNSEPFIVDLPIKVSVQTNKILFNLSTIPGELIKYLGNYHNLKLTNDFVIKEELVDSNKNRIFVFREEDLNKIIDYQCAQQLEQLNKIEYNNKKGGKFTWQITNFQPEKGIVNLSVHLEKRVTNNFDLNKIKQDLLAYKTTKQQKTYLNTLAGIKQVIIKKRWLLPNQRIDIFINVL